MKNNRFIKNTFILIMGGFLTKVLGFIVKILYTRFLKEDGVSLVTLVFPTYTLLLTLSSFALPLAVTKLIAENKERKSKILFSSFWITMMINLLIIVLFLLFANYFSTYILHEKRCGILIKILCFSLPFVSTTSIIKAYFFGIENVKPIVLSNTFEEIIKLIMIVIFLPKIVLKGTLYGVSFYLFINFICEIISFITLFIFLPKKINLKNLSYKYDSKCAHNMTKISIPTLSARLLGSIGYFFEPIILTNLLIYKNADATFIRLNYGYFHGYVIALLTIPSFFLASISLNIVPLISKKKINKDFISIKKIINKIVCLILICGSIYVIFLNFFGKSTMDILYKTRSGYKYLKILLPFFVLFYLEGPLMAVLQSLDQEKKVLKISTLGLFIKYVSLTLLIIFNVGFYSLVISEIINIIFVVFLCIYYLRKYFYYPSQ
ncbi:MAG: oligosaccharide flippase family protein [Bacilli bacterium]|nr:oligosaccharide flippase family protein [Bacilli bacterium]